MKNRFLSVMVLTPLMLVIVLSGVLPAILPLLKVPTASAAATDDYAFNSPSDSTYLTKLKQDLDDQNSAEQSAELGQTAVYVKGGKLFRSTGFKLSLDPDRSGCAQASHYSTSGCNGTDDHFGGQDGALYVYTGTYYCQVGKGLVSQGNSGQPYWTVEYDVALKLDKTGNSDAALFNGTKLKNNALLHWVGFGSKNSAGVQFTDKDNSGSTRPTVDHPIKDLPTECQPPDVPSKLLSSDSNDSELSNYGTVNQRIPVLSSTDTSPSIVAAWKTASVTGGSEDEDGDGSGSDADLQLSCHAGTNPLNWVVCPIVQGMVQIIGVVDNILTSQLSIGNNGDTDQPNQIFYNSQGKCETASTGGSNSCDNFYTAAETFDHIALGMMAVAGLIILVAQALGMELLSAYTIKTALPAFLIAAIGIVLSWPLFQFAVTLTNDLSFGIRHLIYAPFAGSNTSLHFNTGQALGVSLIVGIPAIALEIFGLLCLAATGAMAVFTAFAILVLQHIVVIMLGILAGPFIACYILPNTRKAFKFWWETSFKTLLMLPLISAFIASGHVFAVIALSEGGGLMTQMIAFVGYFGPYFATASTARFAGSILGAAGNLGSNMTGGLRGKIKEKRQANTSASIKRKRDGKSWTPGWGKYDMVNGKIARRLGTKKHNVGALMEKLTTPEEVNEAMRDENGEIMHNEDGSVKTFKRRTGRNTLDLRATKFGRGEISNGRETGLTGRVNKAGQWLTRERPQKGEGAGTRKALLGGRLATAGSVADRANKLMLIPFDADQMLPYLMGQHREDGWFGTGLFKKGAPLTKRYSANLQSRIDRAKVEQTAEFQKNIHGGGYEAGRIGAGMMEDLHVDDQMLYADHKKDGKLSEQFGVVARDAEGNAIKVKDAKSGKETLVWHSVVGANEDLEHNLELGRVATQSKDSKIRLGGQQIMSLAGTVSSATRNADHRYANVQAAFAMNVAQAGRTDHLAKYIQRLSDTHGPGAAMDFYKVLADADSRLRPEERHGYSITPEMDHHGKVVAWHDTLELANNDSIPLDDSHMGELRKGAIKTSFKQLTSAGPGGYGKGESVDMNSSLMRMALLEPEKLGSDITGDPEWSNIQKGIYQTIVTQASTGYSTDPGIQRGWMQIKEDVEREAEKRGVSLPEGVRGGVSLAQLESGTPEPAPDEAAKAGASK